MGINATKLLGNAPVFLRTLHAARMVASTDAPVMVLGERGTGKELLAREVHAASPRREQTFEVIRCAGMADALFEQRVQAYAAEQAVKGTLFFDEVGELSLAAQSILLQFLNAVDARTATSPDVRIIASSSEALQPRVDKGLFRPDLYYRMHIVPLEVPPLRQREGDVMLLIKRFSSDLARQYRRKAPNYSVTARNLLKAYSWPGNVRELRNFCERMVILFAGQTVQPENLPQEIRQGQVQGIEYTNFRLPKEGIDLQALEGDMIRQALTMAGGNRSKAARLLKVSRDTLLYRIQKHAIEV